MIANFQEQIANLQDEILFLNRDLIKKDNWNETNRNRLG
jgi:uncharacterized small protein (DUF1192 family)